jgi:hypothetical protein
MNIEALLDALAEMMAERDLIRIARDEQIEKILAPVRSELDAVEEEFAGRLAAADSKIAALEEQIKRAVAAHGESVRGKRLIAVYQRGRVTWNTDLLETMAKAAPEVLLARRVGDPVVVIRKSDK